MKNNRLHVLTYNIHKGFSQFRRRMMVHELREQLRELNPDLIFLQEVQGEHRRHALKIEAWPEEPQYDFLAQDVWQATAYGRNAIYSNGHHGNALLSRFPIAYAFNQDVTQLRFEKRGLLHCSVSIPKWNEPLHCICVHLSLFARSRRKQIGELSTYIETNLAVDAPLIIAGDFNDWQNEAGVLLADRLNLIEIFSHANGKDPGRSFPARRPFLRLDRIYVRGFSVENPTIHSGAPWSKISDHAALSTHLVLNR